MLGSHSEPFRNDTLQDMQPLIDQARELWQQRCAAYVAEHGDQGTCVLSAGIVVQYTPPRCRKPSRRVIIAAHDVTRCQGASVWEASKDEIVQWLGDHGIDAYYWPGYMD